MIAVIEGKVDPKLGSGEKQTSALRIFADGAQKAGVEMPAVIGCQVAP